ncbi:lipase family alpha/beta hydrolase [Pseudoteredinibacter isoporae]|uniref:Triacylglycerol lipase n=1 Tax=Pseudoteredinibacter isoporae TaxID=570281 RepID=A0A7X0MWD6_9GAMM|nr:triacylglycerol lipase [Pseudoteredinibacter isoporae]MBB6520819.1 triacylglycerol lipase [Pseudoteredinibacter isoporae]NHO86385.1 triacylglycerol lipase [Pseudoteredinibacter isoporae]NIB25163.1 triacylglycerol lipase [Pseudoteredinibacter isoporae]
MKLLQLATMKNMAKFLAVFTLIASLSAPSHARSYAKTENPIVLVHGFLGFDSALGVDYWYGVSNNLSRNGATVYTANLSSVNGSTTRGEQLVSFLEELKASYGHDKFNLIGHSQGGFDVRYAASVKPELVASVTAIGSPTTGSGTAEFLLNSFGDDPLLSTILYNGLNIIGSLIESLSGDSDPQNAVATGHVLSYTGAAEFVALHPQAVPTSPCGSRDHVVNGIPYYSWSGTKPFTNLFDASDYVLSITAKLDNEASDGLAGRCASHLGLVIKDNYKWNHVDQVNHLFGLRGWGSANPLSVIRSHANRLKNSGL